MNGKKLNITTNLNSGNTTNKNQHVSLEKNERQHIISTLKETKWKIKGKNGAAEKLNINPSTLFSKMRKLGIERPL